MIRTLIPRRLSSCVLAAGLGVLMAPGICWAAWSDLNMAPGVTPIAKSAYEIHMIILWICVAIGVVVFGAMFYSIMMHRKSRGVQPATFHHSTKAEILWTVVPCIILVFMAIPATKGLVEMEDTSESDITIKVTGYQWKWHYDYLDTDVSFYSDLAMASRQVIHGDPTTTENYLLDVSNPMVIPVGKKVRLLLTADDVIHAWWVPAFGMKKDAIPGFVNEMWIRVDEPGIYRGQCAELCGKDHGFMPIVAVVKPQAEYDSWLASRSAATATASAPASDPVAVVVAEAVK